jgi:hypothetical protein
MYALRLVYQRHRKLVPRLSALLLLGLASFTVFMPAPFAEPVVSEPGAPLELRGGFMQTSWTSDSISQLMTSDSLASHRYATLSFSPATKPI